MIQMYPHSDNPDLEVWGQFFQLEQMKANGNFHCNIQRPLSAKIGKIIPDEIRENLTLHDVSLLLDKVPEEANALAVRYFGKEQKTLPENAIYSVALEEREDRIVIRLIEGFFHEVTPLKAGQVNRCLKQIIADFRTSAEDAKEFDTRPVEIELALNRNGHRILRQVKNLICFSDEEIPFVGFVFELYDEGSLYNDQNRISNIPEFENIILKSSEKSRGQQLIDLPNFITIGYDDQPYHKKTIDRPGIFKIDDYTLGDKYLSTQEISLKLDAIPGEANAVAVFYDRSSGLINPHSALHSCRLEQIDEYTIVCLVDGYFNEVKPLTAAYLNHYLKQVMNDTTCDSGISHKTTIGPKTLPVRLSLKYQGNRGPFVVKDVIYFKEKEESFVGFIIE